MNVPGHQRVDDDVNEHHVHDVAHGKGVQIAGLSENVTELQPLLHSFPLGDDVSTVSHARGREKTAQVT